MHNDERSTVRIEFIDFSSSIYYFLRIDKLLSMFIRANVEISVGRKGHSVYVATTGRERLNAVIALLEISALSPRSNFGIFESTPLGWEE